MRQGRKRFALHSFLVAIAVGTAWQGSVITSTGYGSLLYTAVVNDEISEGPLDPTAYAQAQGGVGGERLAATEGALASDIITFDDPEVGFAAALGGNAVVGPLNPLAGEASEGEAPPAPAKKPTIYTVEQGDTLGSIASHFNIDLDTLRASNGIGSSDIINPGDHLTILPTKGVLHTVASGDTVSALAKKYQVDATEIIAYNELDEEASLSLGQKLIIPGGKIPARRLADSTPSTPQPPDEQPTDETTPPPPPATNVSEGWFWPTTTKHLSQYFRYGHTGIDIDNRARPAIYAAQPGTVEFTGWLGGYGKLIIVSHGNGLQTYYAHLDQIHVTKGQEVGKGSAIGKMGSTGRSSGPHLHFEVRRHGRPINPLGMF